ncbi:MAG: MTH1187 family thiamine-binding protein [Planctomycetota bacterium]
MAMLLEFSMFPLGKGESVSPYVAGSLDIIDGSGVPYKLNSMGTVLEGDWEEVMGVVKQCLDKMTEKCDRVDCVMKFDWRRGAVGRLTGKIASVEEKLGRELKK